MHDRKLSIHLLLLVVKYCDYPAGEDVKTDLRLYV